MIVGRRAELEAARRLLAGGVRVLTIWGPPGIGKTRLAEALCAEARPAPVRVSLAAVSGLDGLVAAVGLALADPSAEPDPARLAGRWLCLHDVEHLVDGPDGAAVTRTLARWLEQAPGLQVLATSRRLLRLAEEHALALEPLPTDDGVALFVEEVRRRRPGWSPPDDERPALASLVGALDGIPLAIALAAARWELLGTDALRARLSEPLGVLARPRADDPRHATLRAAIAGSWDLLREADRDALTAVATFEGPFDVAAAEALIGDRALEALEALRDAALVQVPRPGTFALLASIRAFARERASPERADALARLHVAWCHSVATGERTTPRLQGDVYVAARWCVEAADPRGDALLTALGGAAPGLHLELLDRAVERLGTTGALRARGRALRLRGRLDDAARDFEHALARAADEGARGTLLRELGVLHHAGRRMSEARDCYERALASLRAAGDARGEAVTIGNLGALDHDQCRYEDALVHYERALVGLRAAGDRRTEAVFLANQAVLRQEQGELAAAEAAYRRALALQRAEGDERMQAITLGNLGLLLHELGRLDEARRLHEEASARFVEVPDPASQALCLARLGAACAALGDAEAAEAAFDRAERVAAPVRDPLAGGVVALFRAFLDLHRGDRTQVDRRIGGAAAVADLSGDARVALRLLRRAAPAPDEVLRVLEDGFVPPGGERQDLARFASCRRMFQALVDAHARSPGASLSIEALFLAGWPGETIAFDSMRNRIHVNLARLRSLGLKGALLRTESGWHLDPKLRVVR